MVRYVAASAAAVMILLLVGLAPAGSSQVPQAPQAGSGACAGVGGVITFDPPLTAALGTGQVEAQFNCVGTCAPAACGPVTAGFVGTYRGDCTEALIETPNWSTGEMNLWGGRLLQVTGGPVFVPNFVVVMNFVAVLAPVDPCNQAATAVLASTLALVGECRPAPGSDGCG